MSLNEGGGAMKNTVIFMIKKTEPESQSTELFFGMNVSILHLCFDLIGLKFIF